MPFARSTEHALPERSFPYSGVDSNQALQFAPRVALELNLFTVPQQDDAPVKFLRGLRQSRRKRHRVRFARFVVHEFKRQSMRFLPAKDQQRQRQT